MREELTRKDLEIATLKTKLDAQTQQQSDYQTNIFVLNESIKAKDQQISVLLSNVRMLNDQPDLVTVRFVYYLYR